MPRKPEIPLLPAQRAAHERACAGGEPGYVDPVLGLFVMTEVGLRARGSCCGSACRHCPFDWINVPDAAAAAKRARLRRSP